MHAARTLLGALLALGPALASPAARAGAGDADVVVVVDTSMSMAEPGFDPERTSLLVSKLLSDIVPGELAVVRFLDLARDAALLPSREMGTEGPCDDDPSRMCPMVEPAGDWYQLARDERYGVLERPRRGDAAFKGQLDAHLAQTSGNSVMGLAFQGARGVWDQRAGSTEPRTLIWLSDGKPRDAEALQPISEELVSDGVRVVPIVFGAGSTEVARGLHEGFAARGLGAAFSAPRSTSGPAELMEAFADAFRIVVGAPHGDSESVSAAPRFEIHPGVDEAWVVVFGDTSLTGAALEGPDGRRPADHAADQQPGAGAYRVAHLEDPSPGTWTVTATGGGPEVSYAVVQRASLLPVLLEPRAVQAGTEAALVAGLQAGDGGGLVTAADVLAPVRFTGAVEGRELIFRDDGAAPDAVAGDGRFTATHRFSVPGEVPVLLRAQSPILDREVTARVTVSTHFAYAGAPLGVDLGSLAAGDTACRPLAFEADWEGPVPLALEVHERLPSGHTLELREGGRTAPAGEPLTVEPGAALELCLLTGERAPSSTRSAAPLARLAVPGAGPDPSPQAVPLVVSWELGGMPWWQRWLWLILTVAGLLLATFIAGGFLWPRRFNRNLGVAFGLDREQAEEEQLQPVARKKGVGIGFYRHARLYVLRKADVGGSSRDAVARVVQAPSGLRIHPVGGVLFRDDDDEWIEVREGGDRVRLGDIYRAGEQGPYFRFGIRGRG